MCLSPRLDAFSLLAFLPVLVQIRTDEMRLAVARSMTSKSISSASTGQTQVVVKALLSHGNLSVASFTFVLSLGYWLCVDASHEIERRSLPWRDTHIKRRSKVLHREHV